MSISESYRNFRKAERADQVEARRSLSEETGRQDEADKAICLGFLEIHGNFLSTASYVHWNFVLKIVAFRTQEGYILHATTVSDLDDLGPDKTQNVYRMKDLDEPTPISPLPVEQLGLNECVLELEALG